MAPQNDIMTAEELWRMPSDDLRHELVNGLLTTMSPMGLRHEVVKQYRDLADEIVWRTTHRQAPIAGELPPSEFDVELPSLILYVNRVHRSSLFRTDRYHVETPR